MFLLLIGCGEDDRNEQEVQQASEFGGIVYRSQIVLIPASGSLNDEYQATFGDNSIVVYKFSDEELFFVVPPDEEISSTILTIPNLENRSIEYEVRETVLGQTVEETLNPLLSGMSDFKNEIENDDSNSPEVQNAISILEKFDQELNQANDEEKQIFAEFYHVNKSFIDEIYNTDYTIALARNFSNLTDTEAFFNLGKAIGKAVTVSLGAFVLIEVPFVNLAAAAIAVKTWYDAYDLFYYVKSRNIFTIDFFINDIPSSLSGNSDQIIIYSHSLSREDIIVYEAKPFDESQSESNIEALKKFFSARRLMNNAINKLNSVIEFVNNNLSTNFSSFNTFILDDAQIHEIEMTDDIFNNLTFDVADNNIDINEISFQNNTITSKFSIIDQDTVDGDYIETTLNFHYQDDFNDIQGSYPIRVLKENENSKWFQKNIDITGKSGGYCTYQEGKSIKLYINVIQENDNYFGRVYYYDLDGIIGVSTNLSFSLELFEEVNGILYIPNAIAELTSVCDPGFSVAFPIKMTLNAESMQIASTYTIGTSASSQCTPCHTESYLNDYSSPTFIGNLPPDDL